MDVYPNLKVYVSKSSVCHFPEKLEKSVKYIINFYIPLDFINADAGKKIETFINEMERHGFEFTLLPLPRCFFEPNCSKLINEKTVDKIGKFFVDGLSFRFIFDEEIEEFEGRLVNISQCLNCKFKRKNECKGIFVVEPQKMHVEKMLQWFLSYIQKRSLTILDLGCGEGQFIEHYAQSARKNGSLFICADPSVISINSMNSRIPPDSKPNIFPLISTGENMPLNNNSLDFVLLHYSYSHFANLDKTLENIKLTLKDDGFLLVFEACHTKDKIAEMLKTGKGTSEFPILRQVEFRNHNLQEAKQFIKEHGFEILDSFEIKERGRISFGIRSRKK